MARQKENWRPGTLVTGERGVSEFGGNQEKASLRAWELNLGPN